MKQALNAQKAAEALQTGKDVTQVEEKPISSCFRYHVITTEDPAKNVTKNFRIACATALPANYGKPQQDYTPEMLCWDQMRVDMNQAPEMANLCEFNVDEYQSQIEDSARSSEFASGHLKAFKYHIHFVQDPKVGEKKFFVASMTALPRFYGAEEQHYTPEMLRWDEMQLAARTINNPSETMAAACGTSVDEIQGVAHVAEEQTEEALFKHHVHEVPDPKVGVKKFFVASMTSTAAHYGLQEQHYTPEMYHWDCLRRDNPELRQGDTTGTMAEMCGEKMESYE